LTNEEREAYKENLSAGVNVMTGFGTVFFVRPKDARFDTVIDDRAGEALMANTVRGAAKASFLNIIEYLSYIN